MLAPPGANNKAAFFLNTQLESDGPNQNQRFQLIAIDGPIYKQF